MNRSVNREERRYTNVFSCDVLSKRRIQPADQGMHIVAWLPDELDDMAVAIAANKAGIALRALSPMCSSNLLLSGLMLGFGGFTGEQLSDAVCRLRRVLEESGCR